MGAPKINHGSQTIKKQPTNSEMICKDHQEPQYKDLGKNNVKVLVWELPIRLWHWINFAAIIVLMLTGLYIARPIFGATVQEEAYFSFVMGWVRWIHFISAYIFTAGIILRIYWTFKGNKYSLFNIFKKGFFKEMFHTVKFYLFMPHKKPHYVGHNPLAQMSYWLMFGGCSLILIFTGFYMYMEPQKETLLGKMFAWVPMIFGDSSSSRSFHHFAAWIVMVFMFIHVYLAWREDYLQRNGTMSSIITGYKTEPKKYVVGEENQDETIQPMKQAAGDHDGLSK